MKKSFVLITWVVWSICCNNDHSDRSSPISLTTDRPIFYTNESVQFQLQVEKDSVYVNSCGDLRINAVLERRFNDEWVSLGSMSDSVYDRATTEGMTDSIFLLDSGDFRIRLPYRYLDDTNNVYSECFTVLDTARHKIGITTEKLCYSENDETMRISIINQTDSTIYFTSCGGNTDFWVWELRECGSWSGYWGNLCLAIFSPQWHSIPSDSLYHDLFRGIYLFDKGVYRIEYNFYDSQYSMDRISVYSNVFTFE